MGHDLRAAVSDILGGLRLVAPDSLDDNTRLQFERVRAAGEVMARLLEEGLLLVAEQTGAGEGTPVPVARLLYDLEMRWAPRAQEKALDLQIALAPDVPPVLVLDRIALERVLANILSNAIKYSDGGAVRISVTLDSCDEMRFTVTDDGPGFAPEVLARLFQPGARHTGCDKPGQGLGMFITKDMTARLGGTIAVVNRAEGGACVTLALPVRRPVPAELPHAQPLPDLTGLHVLVAEDSETNQAVIGHMLTAMGATFDLAADGRAALVLLQRTPFDLAIIDIEMPLMSGLELMRVLRAREGAPAHLPIVACTAYVLRANREAIYAAGADSIVAKPLVGIEPLSHAITRARARIAREMSPGMALPACDAAELNNVLFAQLMEAAGPDGAQELLSRLIADLARIERGLVTALSKPDFDAIRADTHVLIAISGAVGAEQLQKQAEALNSAAHARNRSGIEALGRAVLSHVDRLIHFATKETVRREGPTP
ncbi:MAG: response regulator [Paracoccaceae bacterium]|nr:response regulator [Paracoccaceae bacterium]